VRQRIEGATDRPDFISPMLEANRNGLLSLDEVEQQASILILAGSETTSLALTFTTALLLQHPVILNRLTEEIRALFTSDTDITTSTINDLSYLQAVIQESLRMAPPITNGFPRQTPEEGAMVAGHFIPKDVSSLRITCEISPERC
jgi:cytochrome P450